MRLFAGIDIGKKGAIAVIDEQSNIVFLEDFPKKDPVKQINLMFYHGIKLMSHQVYCIKEEPLKKLAGRLGGTYAQGISIGVNIGIWEACLSLNNIWWKDVHPRTLQKIFPEFSRPGGKERSAAAAIREIPDCEKLIYGPRGGLKDGRSDAILLSIFCKLLVDRGMFR